jgi:hypothetical protein
METKEMKARAGEMITLDISDEACLKFGFKAGTRVTDPNGYKSTLAGVARGRGGCFSSDDEYNVMWYKKDKNDYVSYYSSSKNLKNEGFKEIKK